MNNQLSDAYWISPEGEFFGVTRHIEFVSSNLEKFGMTREQYELEFNKTDEKLGVEGRARQNIIWGLIEKGWIRARYNVNHGWTIEPWELNPSTKENIKKWILHIIKLSEKNPKYPVKDLKIHLLRFNNENTDRNIWDISTTFEEFLNS